MATHNTHRSAGRAVTPLRSAHVAARGIGGAAVLGTVLVGSAVAASSATAAPAAPAPAAPVTAPAAPVAAEAAPAAPSTALSSTDTLRFGSRGDAVRDLQQALNANGSSLAVDGVFGSRTSGAVTSYQSANGLQVDGIVGPQTRASLNGGTAVPSGGASVSTGTSTNSIVERARSAKGTAYSWGGSSLGGMDCSGLVNFAYAASGIDVPRTSSQIANGGRWVSQSSAQPGDIVVWPGHVAIYAGGNTIIDASGSKQRVVEREIWGNPTGFVTYR